MIPARLLLRAATVLALTRGGEAPFPTMAADCVFDSKMLPIVDVLQEGQTPVILVYTDEDKRENQDRNSSRPQWQRTVSLLIEIAIGTVSRSKTGGEFALAETDAELEAMIDILEAEVEVALAAIDNPYAVYWRKIARRVETWNSVPFRTGEQTARYAIRQIAMDVEVAADCLPVAIKQGEKLAIATGNLLPIPYLEALAKQISSNPAAFASTIALLSGASQQTPLPTFKRFGMNVTGPIQAEVTIEEQQ